MLGSARLVLHDLQPRSECPAASRVQRGRRRNASALFVWRKRPRRADGGSPIRQGGRELPARGRGGGRREEGDGVGLPAHHGGRRAEPAPQPLGPRERRVAGVLIEKQKTTPDVYPMSIAAIVTVATGTVIAATAGTVTGPIDIAKGRVAPWLP